MIRSFIAVAIISILPISASFAEKLVDPNTVAPEFRVAAEKRRAEQLKQRECAHRADVAKVLPRDRTTYIQQCLDEP